MSNKVIIAKPGFDAKKETNPNNLIFSSDYNTLKYYASGFVDVAWTEGATLWEGIVTHNLGYIPFFLVYVIDGGGSYYNLVPRVDDTLAGENYTNAYADTTKLYCQIRKNQGLGRSGTERFYYKLFKNNLGF